MIKASPALDIRELVDFAAQGLPQMVDPTSQLFCHRLKKTESGVEREGVSPRYSMMTLLGLHRLEASGRRSPVDIQKMLEVLLRDLKWIAGAGDLGLLLWTCAVLAPERLKEVCAKTHPQTALQRYADTQRGATMETAWYLTGVAHCQLAGYADVELTRQAGKAFELLKENCGQDGLFGHLSTNRSFVGRLRGRIGSFADQVYPACALSAFAKVFNNPQAKGMAVRTAQAICDRQGPLGQWWWHYDSASGSVVSHHPVYSVHQHAMGPMALIAVADVSGKDFHQQILGGVEWITGRNELNLDMRDDSHHVIWRSFFQNSQTKYSNALLSMVGLQSSPKGLRVKYECRPYELGWLLYALAGFIS